MKAPEEAGESFNHGEPTREKESFFLNGRSATLFLLSFTTGRL